ncbi:MAG: DUF120 domain-containing protein [Candidatus Micrarchaeota archaeon]
MLRKPSADDVLFLLLSAGADARPIRISTTEIAEELGVPQQTVSRWLIQLCREGLLSRSPEGIRLTDSAVEELRALHSKLKGAFELQKQVFFEGKVFSGMMDGKYYLSFDEYKKQFKEKFGFVPYPGTLNLKLAETNGKRILQGKIGAWVRGFEKNGRVFGAIKTFPALINSRHKGAVVLPERSHYGPDVLEVIAPFYIRGKLKLKDGDKVRVEVFTEERK